MSDPAEPAALASPAEELSTFVVWSAALFYEVEKGENPAVRDYWDAFHYVATSLSVGYAQIFPVTPLGKLIGGVVMMLGPALAAKALDAAHPPEHTGTAPMVHKLDEILVELRRLNAANG